MIASVTYLPVDPSRVSECDHILALNHHTSKLTSLSSLTTLTSFGFRGEALSSLCALSESVVVTTATDSDGQKGVGVKLEMGKRGDVMKKSVVARQVGIYPKISSTPSVWKIHILTTCIAWHDNKPVKLIHSPPRPTEGVRA